MGKITVTKNQLPEIVQVCRIRKVMSLSCINCGFHGEPCDSFKETYKVDVPEKWDKITEVDK